MNSINQSSYNTLRLSGLASGIDTESIIKNLMQIEQIKVNRELRSQTKLEWKQEALNSVANDLKEFRQTYMSVLSDKNMLTESLYTKFNVTTSGDTSGYVTITANNKATSGALTIQHIEQLATSTKSVSAAKVSNGGELSASNDTLLGYLDFANDIGFVEGEVSFAINGQTFTFKETDSLHKMMSTINGNEAAGVTLSYSRLTDKFTLSAKASGAGQEITFSNITGNVFGATGALGISTADVVEGQNAKLVVEGEYIERTSNSFEVDGIFYNLHRAHGELQFDADNKPIVDEDNFINITLKQDIEPAVTAIKEFVNGYNTMVEKLNNLLTAEVDRDYFPLTDSEKAEMTEEQIEQWEEIAKTGILRNDSGIQSMLDSMRSALYEKVGDTGLSPAEIGLKTGDWRNKGQIEVDEDVLRAALTKDSDQVMRVFCNNSESTDPATVRAESGLLYRMTGALDSYTKNFQSDTLANIAQSIRTQKDKISAMEDRMKDLEERYYLKYAAMEQALANLQSQTDWVSSMMYPTAK